jgi:hypothetical protein
MLRIFKRTKNKVGEVSHCQQLKRKEKKGPQLALYGDPDYADSRDKR